jgi:UDP-N-acetylmuramoyl-L-alanyl-D-glutamate--2,6-diaminopimelate ligase
VEIIRQIQSGYKSDDCYEVIENREEAIAGALRRARPGDFVLIAGKGHENYQEFADTIIPFDDREAVREALEDGSSYGC